MSGCRSSRPVPAARREERVSNKHFAPSGLLAGALKGWGCWRKRLWQALGSPFFASEMGGGPPKMHFLRIDFVTTSRARCEKRAGQGRAGQGRAGCFFRLSLESASLRSPTPFGVRPRPPGGQTQKHPNGEALLPNGREVRSGVQSASTDTLGRGPRSEPRAPMQTVSGALGSLGCRV